MFNWSLRNGSQNQDIEKKSKAGHNGAYGCVAFDGDVVRDKPVSSCHGSQPTHHPTYLRDQLERHTVWDIDGGVFKNENENKSNNHRIKKGLKNTGLELLQQSTKARMDSYLSDQLECQRIKTYTQTT